VKTETKTIIIYLFTSGPNSIITISKTAHVKQVTKIEIEPRQEQSYDKKEWKSNHTINLK